MKVNDVDRKPLAELAVRAVYPKFEKYGKDMMQRIVETK